MDVLMHHARNMEAVQSVMSLSLCDRLTRSLNNDRLYPAWPEPDFTEMSCTGLFVFDAKRLLTSRSYNRVIG